MKFGEFIKNKREQKSWSQPEAAVKADIEQSYLSKIERGKSFPSEEVFGRLVEVFEIDVSEMNSMLYPGDLDRLREIKEVRVNLLEKQKSERTLARGWLIAGLTFLMLSGACFGVVLSSHVAQNEYYYRSMGVLTDNEPLRAFDVLLVQNRVSSSTSTNNSGAESQIQSMMKRLDQHEIITTTFRGDAFIENVSQGKRFYQIYHQQEQSGGSPLRWFLVPTFMFFFGSLGSFFISLRWQ